VGEAVLGIVYATDAKVEPGVKIVGTFPADTHPPIIYPVAATTTAKPEANDYLAYLRSAAAKAVLEKYGFTYLIRRPPDVFEITPPEWTAIQLSLRVAAVATLVATPLGVALAWLLARRDFWGKVAGRCAGSPAAGAAAGRHRLSPAVDVRSPRPGRCVACGSSRHRVRVPLDRSGRWPAA